MEPPCLQGRAVAALKGVCKVASPATQPEQLTDDMSYYRPSEKRTAQLSARVTPTVKRGLLDLARLWTAMEKRDLRAKLRGTKTPDEINEAVEAVTVTEADVANRLLDEAIPGAFAEALGFEPSTDAEWLEVEKKLEKGLDPSRKK